MIYLTHTLSFLTVSPRHSTETHGIYTPIVYMQLKKIDFTFDRFFHDSLFLHVYTLNLPPQLKKNNRFHNLPSLRYLFNIYLLVTLLIAMRPELFAASCDNRRETKEYLGGGLLVRSEGGGMWSEAPLFYGEHEAELGLCCLLLICLCPCSTPTPAVLLYDIHTHTHTCREREKKRLIKKPK